MMGEKLGVVWVFVLVFMFGECFFMEDEFVKSFYVKFFDYDCLLGIWDVNFMVGYVWVDEFCGIVCVVVMVVDWVVVVKVVDMIVMLYWDVCVDFCFGLVMGLLEEMLVIVDRIEMRFIVFVDFGDNLIGGGVGDWVDVFKVLIVCGFDGVVIGGIIDWFVVDVCFVVGEGVKLWIKIGGLFDLVSFFVEVDVMVVWFDDLGVEVDW